MIKRVPSLLNTLFRSLLLPGIVAVILGVFIVFSLVREEYDELQDMALASKAHLLLQVFEAQTKPGDITALQGDFRPLSFEHDLLDADELTQFWVLDAEGHMLLHSTRLDDEILTARIAGGFVTALGFRITDATTQDGSLTVVAATPMEERNEAIRDVVLGVITGFVLLGFLVAGAAYVAVRRSAAVIVELSTQIESKDAHDLSPINRTNTFAEIEPAIDKMDTLMARLDAALKAERAFATNAAHELRTPVAICLAHVQRLRTKLTDTDTSRSAADLEQGLKRLTRLIERLLQMARAQSGLGVGASAADIAPVIKLLLRELRERVPSPEMLVVTEPQGVWMSNVDPDAIGIILNNLFDNALKHASGDAPMIVDASTHGLIVISNDCPALAPDEMAAIKQRFSRHSKRSAGFGLGLSIVQELCEQSDSTLELASPCRGQTRGFSARVTFSVSEGK